MARKDEPVSIRERFVGVLEGFLQEAYEQQPAPETDPDRSIKNLNRLLQLVKAGLVPEDLMYKMFNVLKDPKRFGVTPKLRNQLFDVMIKTLNYIVIDDHAAWARYRNYLLRQKSEKEKAKETIDQEMEEQRRTPMDKREMYKNLNEEVNRMLRKHRAGDLNEQFESAAQELAEAMEDPAKVNALLKTGLVDPAKLSRVRTALKDPDKAMKNAGIRYDLINMLMSLINIVTTNPGVYQKVRKSAKDMGEPVHEGKDAEYDAFFRKALEKFGKSGVGEMNPEEKKKFFNYVDANWKGRGEVKEGKAAAPSLADGSTEEDRQEYGPVLKTFKAKIAKIEKKVAKLKSQIAKAKNPEIKKRLQDTLYYEEQEVKWHNEWLSKIEKKAKKGDYGGALDDLIPITWEY